jgi:NAD(P)-dependent dehydrogenase (short-subunit alcohol dehydrogenase family)
MSPQLRSTGGTILVAAGAESMKDLDGRTVLVTGGAQGIGKGLAKACLGAGARVVITNLDETIAARTVAELSALGSIRSVRCDATDRAAVDALLDQIWAVEGPIDVAFCNAGAGAMAPILEVPMEQVRGQFALNLESAIHLTQSLVPRLLAAGRPGHIMFTGSENSLVMPHENRDLAMGVYGGTKHALLVIAEWLRYELAETPVTVSVLLPGPVLTERLAATFDALAADPVDPALRGRFPQRAEQTLRERFISTDECAALALAGLRKGLFYIPTQAYILEDVEARYREIREAFAAMGLIDP